MKLFAQHGFQDGEKIAEAIDQHILDGVIYSPRDISLVKLQEKLAALETTAGHAERLFDPQYYASFLKGTASSRLGYLADEYPYLNATRRQQLERESQVEKELRAVFGFQSNLKVSKVIAPNILIPSSLDSVEAVIAKNFIRMSGEIYNDLNDSRPLLVTLALSRDALLDTQELNAFLNEITILDNPPAGFYLLIAARSSDARTELYNTDVVAAWMLLNHTLALNGFEVINGYSDIMTPFLGAAGGNAGAFGWWSNLRTFSLDRFAASSGGGRLPIQRYLSNALLNRITYFELEQLRVKWPGVLNGLANDSLYPVGGSEPPRNREVVQSWEAIQKLNSTLIADDQLISLKQCENAVSAAIDNYDLVKTLIPRLDIKSNDEHLASLQEGMSLFRKMAELE